MKKLLLLAISLLGLTSNAQNFDFGKSRYFTASVSIDPSATIKEKSPNLVGEIEVVNACFYVKASVQVLPALKGGYIDYGGAVGLNFQSGYFDNIRYYTGVRMGTIRREMYGYPLIGFEGGVDVQLTDKLFIGFRGTGDYRSDFKYSGADPEMRFSSFGRIGVKF